MKEVKIEKIKAYCRSLPLVTFDYPFDATTLVFRVLGKIFVIMNDVDYNWFGLKCDPEYSRELKERYTEVESGWHLNKKHWIQIDLFGSLSDEVIQHLIRHSYVQVVRKMPKRVLREHPEIDIQAPLPK